MESGDGSEPWYSAGLPFECTRCGRCCTGAPGFVWLTVQEMEALAARLGLAFSDFTGQYVRQVGDRYSLIEKPNHDCIFWESGHGCAVYEVRPVQCRTWPFWPAHLESAAAWARTQSACPGTRGGPLIPVEEIEAQARRAALAFED